MEQTPDTIVIGLGNPLMSDDGIGICLARALAAELVDRPGVECVDAGTSGMRALHLMAGRARAILIDCALMDETPGVIRRFTPEGAESRRVLSRLSLHEGNLLEILELSRALGERPAEVVIFGIEPARLTPGAELSRALASRLPTYLRAILDEIG